MFELYLCTFIFQKNLLKNPFLDMLAIIVKLLIWLHQSHNTAIKFQLSHSKTCIMNLPQNRKHMPLDDLGLGPLLKNG